MSYMQIPHSWELLFWLIAGHALADFGLQSDWVATNKNPNLNRTSVNWYYVMLAHSLIHGIVVAWFTSPVLGVAETAAHFIIDCGKCDNKYDIHMDQLLHVLCKVTWLAIYLISWR